MSQIEIIRNRLEESQPDYITHIIECELEEKNIIIFLDDEKKGEISLLLENKDIIEKEGLNISKVITDNILEDVICFNGDREEMIDVIDNIIKNQKKLYSSFKKYWMKELINYYNKKDL